MTPEAYYLFDTPAAGVPELCDAFKVRYVFISTSYVTSSTDTISGKNPWSSTAAWAAALVARHRSARAHPAGRPPPDTQHQDTCPFAKWGGHRTRTVLPACRRLLCPAPVGGSRPRSRGTLSRSSMVLGSKHLGTGSSLHLDMASLRRLGVGGRPECTRRVLR